MLQRWKIISVAVVVIVIALIVVYYPDMDIPIEVTCDDFTEQGNNISKEIVASAFVDQLIITLCSNQTTGFQWEIGDISTTSDDLIYLKDNQYLPPEDSEIVGAGGEEVWTFGVYRKGSANITMEYSQPWDEGIKAERTFTLMIDAH
jgi:predicted secreted protein